MFAGLNLTQQMEVLRERDETELQAEHDAEIAELKNQPLELIYYNEKLWNKVAERRVKEKHDT